MIKDKLQFSQAESARFGLRILRGQFETMEEGSFTDLQDYLVENNAEMAIIRLPSHLKQLHYFLQIKDITVIHADTLLYYECDLREMSMEKMGLRNSLMFEPIDQSNREQLNSLIAIIFKDYTNHYFSNPILTKKSIIEGYAEWAQSYSIGTNERRWSWFVRLNGVLVGLATCEADPLNRVGEGVLYGVHPEYSGIGIYSDILKYTLMHFKNNGFNKMIVSTQVQNYSVQRVWTKHNFTLLKAYDTYHLILKSR